MKLKPVTDPAFHRYGRILNSFHPGAILEEMKHTPLPSDKVIYVPSDPSLEELAEGKTLQRECYGELPIQIGYCNGMNHSLNALEYHRSSEINIAVTDLILLLGSQLDLSADFHYPTSQIEAFLIPAGTVIEVYATTLHYAPCSVAGKPFQCVVILPRGTNEPLKDSHQNTGEDRLLTAVNKWLIAHADASIPGAFNGLTGENTTVE